MNTYLDMLAQIACELEVCSPRAYTHKIHGTISIQVAPEPAVAEEKKELRRLLKALTQFIYFFYNLNDRREVGRLLTVEEEDLTPIMMREHIPFRQQLHDANQGQGYSSPGWEVVQIEDEGIAVIKDGLQLFAQPKDLAVGNPSHLQPGDRVALSFPKDLPYASAGYYIFVSDAGGISEKDALVRLYFHVTAAQAPLVVAKLTGMLLSLHIKYTGKILNHPSAYTRPDSLVVYVAREDFEHVHGSLGAVYSDIQPHLKPAIPRFAKLLAPGIGVAEESEATHAALMSFGQHRSMLVAQGLIQAFLSEKNKTDQRYHAILRAFADEGLDAARPYLDAASPDIYAEFRTLIRPVSLY